MHTKQNNNTAKYPHNIQFSKYFENMLIELKEKLGMTYAATVRTALHEFYMKFKRKEKEIETKEE